jgi:hypothetical protein
MKTPANFRWICRCFRLSAISYRKWNLKQSKIYILAFAARSLRAFQNLSVKLCIYLWFPLIKFISNVQKLIFKQEFPGIQLGYQGLTSGIQNWKLVASRILGYRQSQTLVDIQLYQHSWKLWKREIVWEHNARRAECFHTISSFPNFHECWYNYISIRKKCFIFVL